jgi:hypothetical protein
MVMRPSVEHGFNDFGDVAETLQTQIRIARRIPSTPIRSDLYLYGSAASLSPSPRKLKARMTSTTGTIGSSSHG